MGGEGGGWVGDGGSLAESQDHVLVTVTPTVFLLPEPHLSTLAALGIAWGPQAGPALLGGVSGLPSASLELREGSRAWQMWESESNGSTSLVECPLPENATKITL